MSIQGDNDEAKIYKALRTQNGAQCSIKCQVKLRAEESRVGVESLLLKELDLDFFLQLLQPVKYSFSTLKDQKSFSLVSQEKEPENLNSRSLCDAIVMYQTESRELK